jgi:uncharacterized protein YbjT (DUF2867 family)
MTDIPVTIVGATSKFSQSLIQRLGLQGRRVIALARRIDALPPEQRATARFFDLTQPGSLKAALQGAECVVSSVQAPDGIDVIAALPSTVKRVILMGSTRIFTRYPNDKVERQRQAVDALARSGIPGVVLHPTMIYGPNDGNVQRIAAYIRKFGIVPLPGGGNALLQPIHRDDVVSCVMAALERDSTLGESIIIAGKDAISYRDLVMEIGRALGKTPFVLPVPGIALQFAAALTALVPGIPTIRMDEVRRLGEDKAFPIDDMQRRLGVEPMGLAAGIARSFASSPSV